MPVGRAEAGWGTIWKEGAAGWFGDVGCKNGAVYAQCKSLPIATMPASIGTGLVS